MITPPKLSLEQSNMIIDPETVQIVLYNMFKVDFKTHSKKKCWYEFQKHKWSKKPKKN